MIPVAEKAKPRKISISHGDTTDQAITTGHGRTTHDTVEAAPAHA